MHKKIQKELEKTSIKDSYEKELKMKDEAIAYYKDLKAKLSTKMVGETLEQHCEVEFNKLRASAFQNSYFEKDNDSSGGSKGDFIYKEHDGHGNEIISIMFEMKNEGNGYIYEIEEVNNCLQNDQAENKKHPHSMSLDLISLIDKVRAKIGLTYD